MVSKNDEIDKILVPVDGSEFSKKAVRYAIRIAKMSGASIISVHAIGNPPYVDYQRMSLMLPHYLKEAERQAKEWFDDASTLSQKSGVKFAAETILDVKSVPDAIVDYAKKQNVDLIVIGTHGRSGVKRFLLGSVASGVVSHASCPVLVVR